MQTVFLEIHVIGTTKISSLYIELILCNFGTSSLWTAQ